MRMLPTSSPGQLVIIGSSGILGSALAVASGWTVHGGLNAQLLNSRAVLDGVFHGDTQFVHDALKCGPARQDWLLPFGVVDPRAGRDILFQVNAEAPARLLEVLAKEALLAQRSVRIVTFGSVLEDSPRIAGSNAYIESKAHMKTLLKQASVGLGVGWLHIQLHTLYGGRQPHASMFLGQMAAALQARAPFRMSAGMQLREYHHASDAARNVLQVLTSEYATGSEIELSTGHTIRLRDLAERVFQYFGVPHLLEVGSVEAQHGEIFDKTYARSLHIVAEREPVAGVSEWFTSLDIAREAKT